MQVRIAREPDSDWRKAYLLANLQLAIDASLLALTSGHHEALGEGAVSTAGVAERLAAQEAGDIRRHDDSVTADVVRGADADGPHSLWLPQITFRVRHCFCST